MYFYIFLINFIHLINEGNMEHMQNIATFHAPSDIDARACHVTSVSSGNLTYRKSKQLPIHLKIYPPLFANTKETIPIEKPTVVSKYSNRTLRNVKCHCCVYMLPPLIPSMSTVNPADTFLPRFHEIYFNTYFHLC